MKFKEVQKDVLGMILCHCTLFGKQGCISMFKALDEITNDNYVKTVKYSIYFNEEECDLTCMCALFEMREIPRRHALRVC